MLYDGVPRSLETGGGCLIFALCTVCRTLNGFFTGALTSVKVIEYIWLCYTYFTFMLYVLHFQYVFAGTDVVESPV